MGKKRFAFFIVILAAGASLVAALIIEKPKTRFESTLAPAFQLFGKATGSLSHALTEVMPIDQLDEKKYGEAIMVECDSINDVNDKDFIYVNSVMNTLRPLATKPFAYKVYIQPDDLPNAFALPGGVIFVTRGLLSTLGSESELVAVLSHEMGHVELSHCMDAVRFELLAQKTGDKTIGELADFAMALLMRHSFSKTQESDADNYAFNMLLHSIYDPEAEGRSFESLIAWSKKNGEDSSQHASVLRDYFMSHPPLPLRAEKYSEKGRVWWDDNPEGKRYLGTANLAKRSSKEIADEWITKAIVNVNE